MMERGELAIIGNRVADIPAFMTWATRTIPAGIRIVGIGADRYRKAEVEEVLDGLKEFERTERVWRGQGSSATADGSHDVRAFQRMVLSGQIVTPESLLMACAIKNSSLRFDGSGNPALDRAGGSMGRIDALAASVIAVGMGTLMRSHNAVSYAIV